MPKYVYSFLLLSFLIVRLAVGQSPYQTNGNTERSILLPGGVALGTSLLIGSKNKPISADQLDKLNPRTIWAADRWVTKHYSKKAAKTSDVLLYSSYAIPLTTLLGAKTRKDFGQVGLFAIEGLLLNTAATNLTKVLAKRIRPFVYNPNAPLPPKLAKNARYSFFSGHTSNVATMYFLTATVLQDFYPNKSFRHIIWPTAVIIPAVTGYLRMRAGKHFLTDV